MKILIIIIISFLILSCSNYKKVYWCGDHACVSKKEREAYFKDNMIVEVRDFKKINKEDKTLMEKIKRDAKSHKKKIDKKEDDMIKNAKIEKKLKMKEEKELAKRKKLELKLKAKEEKELAKRKKLEQKIKTKESKKLAKVNENKSRVIKENTSNNNVLETKASLKKFDDLVDQVYKKSMLKPYPDINDIPD